MFCRVLCVAAAAAVLGVSDGHKFQWARCFPDNETEANCFAQLPNAGFRSSTWMKWILPSPEDDAYILNDNNHTRVFDAQEFTIVKVEQDPQYFCDHEDKLLEALSCLRKSVEDKCPGQSRLPYLYTRTAKTLTNVCYRLDDLDKPCLQAHWTAVRTCRISMYGKLSGFRKRHHRRPEPKNVTTTWEHSREYAYCYFWYHVMECARRQIQSCHGPTAQIMFELGMNMTSANCSASVTAWASASVGTDVTDCDDGGRCGATSLLAAAWASLLLPVLVAITD